jgi:hypothetical protein
MGFANYNILPSSWLEIQLLFEKKIISISDIARNSTQASKFGFENICQLARIKTPAQKSVFAIL